MKQLSMPRLNIFAVLAIFSAFLYVFSVGVAQVSAHAQWDTGGNYTIELTCTSGCSGIYPHSLNITNADLNTGNIEGVGHYVPDPSVSWDMTGNVSGNEIEMKMVYNNVNAGYTLNTSGTIASNGTLTGHATSSTGQVFTYQSTSGSSSFVTHGMITSPNENDIATGAVNLSAWYHDESPDVNDDSVSWAVREGTCAAGTNTVFGNVDGHNDSYSWDGADFSASMDTSGFTPGKYCFVFNPNDDAGQNNVRETREFWVAESHVEGGGQIIEETGGKKKDWLKVSFGGWAADVGEEIMGEWQVNFHNVGENDANKGKFHGSDFTEFVIAEGNDDSCEAATRIRIDGTFNGMEGYKLILRAGDSNGPASKNPDDTVRFELFGPEGLVYDSSTEFEDESNCLGRARTDLDRGNIDIVSNS